MLLKDKVVVIYGAGGAVGGAVARAFAREGARLFLTGRNLAPLEAVVKDIASPGGLAEARADRAAAGTRSGCHALSGSVRRSTSSAQLGPDDFVPYHFHHASEEMLVVLEGEMTMRTEEGERLVRRGEVVVFPVGPAGAHGFRNDGEGRSAISWPHRGNSPRWASIPTSARSPFRRRRRRRRASNSGSSMM